MAFGIESGCAEARTAAGGERLIAEIRRIRDDQSLPRAVVSGFVAAAAGAVTWAIITAVTRHHVGWLAVGVGCLVGYAMRKSGRGVDTAFGVAGAALAVAGCIAANVLAVCILEAHNRGLPLYRIVPQLSPGTVLALLRDSFAPLDVVFYGLAAYLGFRLSFRPLGIVPRPPEERDGSSFTFS